MAKTLLGLFMGSSGEDALSDPRALGMWMERQPTNDHLGVQEAIVRLLEDMAARQPKVTPDRVQAVLELDRAAMPVQTRLLQQFLQPSLSDAVRQRLWLAGDDLARWFAYTYMSLFEALLEQFPGRKAKAHLPGVAARMFRYRGQQAKNSLFRYERWIPGRWKGLHAGYEAALKHGLAQQPFTIAPVGAAAESCSAEQEYLQILLMQRVNTGNLGAAQIEIAASWLRAMAHTLILDVPPLEGAGFWLDLGLGDGLLAKKPHQAQGTLLYFDIAPLQREIGNGMIELSLRMQRPGASAAQAAELLAFLRRLEQLWRPGAKPTERRGVRMHSDRQVDVAVGFMEIAAALHGADPARAASYRRIRKGPPVEIATGRAEPALADGDVAGTEFMEHAAIGWRIRDTSESGCKLVSHTSDAARQKLGSLLGMQEQADTRWKIGIVRRLRRFSGGQTELGVEVIAQNALLIEPKALASRDTGYSVDGVDVSVEGKGLVALYLPPMESPGRRPRRSMVVPTLEHAEGRRFFLLIDDNACMVRLTTLIERTKDWVWTEFEIVTGTA